MSRTLDEETGVEGRDPLEELAESFLARLRRGERPTIEWYAAEHPELADRIWDLFPALLALEDHGPDRDSSRGATTEGEDRQPARVGEYRILRRIGRGGMGVVYEAEQESLGRHVALKVLSPGALADEVQIERFRQEARAAARLHHTNIVPVFGVGEDGGILYYSMQYIRGHTIAEVLGEVKRLRGGNGVAPAGASDSSAGAASGLVSGSFESDAYYRSVARLGLQVAEALAYAHGEGVLHRDIKPSNLLLDLRGTVWVTDFGLAKTGDSTDLTASGDVVGTLRYMAPERFRGSADARSDIFSLGVTLYELLTLRPAFEGTDRARLIREVTTRDPPRPGKIDPKIPRDLETIVLKASARLPEDRYPEALELAEDLRRFLNREPVSARRATAAERFWRWCQRNPLIAFLLAGIASLSITLVVGAVISAGKLRVERDTAFQRLVAAKLEEGRAWRRSRAPGQRSRALKALVEAAPGASAFELRNEIIGALALVDLVVEEESVVPEGFLARADGLARSVVRGPGNSLQIYDEARPGQPIAVLPGDSPVEDLRFSPSGRYLVVRNFAAATPVRVWDLDRQSVVLELDRHPRGLAIGFRRDEAEVAAPAGGFIQVWSFPEGKVLRRLARAPSCRELSFDPRGERLAVAGDGEDTHVARVLDAADGRVLARLHHPERVAHLAWHPEKDLLATACFDFNVYLWDSRTGSRLQVFNGHSGEVVRVGFTPDGEILASSGWDNRTFLWDMASGAELISAPGLLTAFSRSGRRLGFRRGEFRGGTWRIEGGTEHRALQVAGARIEKHPHRIVISPDGRWLAAECGSWGVRVWSTAAPGVSVDVEAGRVADIAFHPEGDLLTSSQAGLERWPLREGEGGRWTIGPPQPVGVRAQRFSIDGEGRRLATVSGNGVAVLDLAAAREICRVEHREVNRAQLSSSGRWLLTTTWKGSGVRVWDASSGELLKEIPSGTAHASFSPDERWLAVGKAEDFSVWETGNWTCRYRKGNYREGDVGRMVGFSGDSRLLALAEAIGQLTIRLAETGEELARLDSPVAEKLGWTVFSRSEKYLAWASPADHSVVLWDLGLVRRELAALGLDWDSSSTPEEDHQPPPAALRVEWGGQPPRVRGEQLEQRAHDLDLVESLTRRIELQATPAAYAERAAVHLRLGALDEALADLDLALDYRDVAGRQAAWAVPGAQLDRLGALRTRASLLRRSGEWRLAREDLERIVELDPQDALSARELAFLLCLEPAAGEGAGEGEGNVGEKNDQRNRERPGRALELAEKSAGSGQRDLPLLKALAAASYRLGRLEDAEGKLREALVLAAKRPVPELKLFLAMLCQRAGRQTEARECYEEARSWLAGGRLDRGAGAEAEVLRAEAERVLGGR